MAIWPLPPRRERRPGSIKSSFCPPGKARTNPTGARWPTTPNDWKCSASPPAGWTGSKFPIGNSANRRPPTRGKPRCISMTPAPRHGCFGSSGPTSGRPSGIGRNRKSSASRWNSSYFPGSPSLLPPPAPAGAPNFSGPFTRPMPRRSAPPWRRGFPTHRTCPPPSGRWRVGYTGRRFRVTIPCKPPMSFDRGRLSLHNRGNSYSLP